MKLRLVAAAAVVLALVVGVPSAAVASVPPSPSTLPAVGGIAKAAGEWPFPEDWTQPARPEDLAAGKEAKPKGGGTWKYDASKSKWRGYMINVGSSLLGAAAPKSWQAEQIANRYAQKGMPSGEQLNSQYGYTSVVQDPETGRTYSTAPRGSGTYDDYVIDEAEQQFKGTSKRKGLPAPATKPTALSKVGTVVGGALLAPFAYEQAAALTSGAVNGLGGLFGWDANGTVCGQTSEMSGGEILNWLSGQNCDSWKLAQEYAANSDVVVTYGTDKICRTISGNSYCVQVRNMISQDFVGTGGPTDFYCVEQTVNGVPGSISTYLYVKDNFSGDFYRSAAGTRLKESAGTESWPCRLQVSTDRHIYARQWAEGAGALLVAVSIRTGSADTGAVNAIAKESEKDPQRTLSCSVEYTDGTTLTVQGDPYRESEGSAAPPDCPSTPAGKVPASVSVIENGNGGSKTLSTAPTTDAFKQWATEDPECGTGVCLLDLLIAGENNTYVSCFDLEDGCDGWFQDPDKETNYMCRYGARKVDLAECTVYAGLFASGRTSVGAPYSDPTTGAWSGGQSSIPEGQKAMTTTIQNPDAVRNCDLSTIGMNPIGWVLRPMQCFAEWATIPRPLVVDAAFAGVADVWAEKPPGAIASAVESLSISGAPTGCSISTTYKGTTAPLIDACGGFMGALATFSRTVTLAIMAVLVFAKVRRQIAAMVNYNVGQD